MSPTSADFGKRLYSSTTTAAGTAPWVATGLLLLALAAAVAVPTEWTMPWVALVPRPDAVMGAAGVLGIMSIALGARRRGSRSERHFYEDGATYERGGRRQSLAYRDAEGVTFVVRTAGERIERSVAFTGPNGQPVFSLFTDLAENDPAEDGGPSVAAVQNVATRVTDAVAARIAEAVDRGEVVKWTDGLWLDQAGLRVGDAAHGRVLPWNAVDGVKDGSQSGRIEVYAFGGEQPVATARTFDVNALPGLKAFMRLLDRAQAPAAAA